MDQKRALKQMRFMKKHSDHMPLAAEDWGAPWKILISTILSARNRDEVTIPVARDLFRKYPSVVKLSRASLKDVEGVIRPINFYRNKSRNIVNCAKMLVRDYGGKVPLDEEELVKLPGVGRKTTNVFLSEVGHDAIGVDTHVNYISNRLGWTMNKSPHKVEEDLKKLFDKRHWSKVNSTLVRFGKAHTSRKEKDELLEEIGRIRK